MNSRNTKQKWKRWLEKDLFPEIRYLIKLRMVFRKFSMLRKKKQRVHEISNIFGAAGFEYLSAVYERYNNGNEGRNKQGLDRGEEQI